MQAGRYILFLWFAACLAVAAPPKIVILGDSLAAGYGVDIERAFPALLQRELDREKIPATVVNAGISGNTTAGGLRRLDWLLRGKPDILVVTLGGNDGLRGLDPAASRQNLEAIIDKARKAQPGLRILLTGMKSPPNMGKEYTEAFEAIFAEVAKSRETAFVPFLLEGVGGVAEQNQADGIHPNEAGHETICRHLLPAVRTLLQAQPASGAGER